MVWAFFDVEDHVKIDDEHTKHAVFCLMYSFPIRVSINCCMYFQIS